MTGITFIAGQQVRRRLPRGTDAAGLGMTIRTGRWCAREKAVAVTGFALGESMRAVKPKAGREMIEFRFCSGVSRREREQHRCGSAGQCAQQRQTDDDKEAHLHALDLRERRSRVAGFTVVAEASEVWIVAAMTGVAVIGNRGTAADGFTVAGIAGESRVRARQRKISLMIMVELPCPPVRRVVAVIALLAETSMVRVVVDVTGNAGAVRVVERRGRMALFTAYVGVSTDQRKAGDIMIEP